MKKVIIYEVSSDSASRIASDKLELHIDPCEEILFLGSEARGRGLVKRKREMPPSVEYFGSLITKHQVEFLPQITRQCSPEIRRNAHKHKQKKYHCHIWTLQISHLCYSSDTSSTVVCGLLSIHIYI